MIGGPDRHGKSRYSGIDVAPGQRRPENHSSFAIKRNNAERMRACSQRAVDLLSESSGTLWSPFERTFYARRATKKRKMSVTFIMAEILGGIYAGRALTSRL